MIVKVHAPLALLGVVCLLVSCRSGAPERAPGPSSNGPGAAAVGSEALCALCEKPIPAGKEVLLVAANGESQPYRCVHCALTAQAATSPPSTVTLRSPLSNTEITIRRGKNGWSVAPSTAVFLSLPEAGGECVDRHRAFPDRDEYRRYLSAHPELPTAKAVPYSIDRIAELLAAGLPATGIRPNAPVQLLVVGMLTHLPFKESVQPVLEEALKAAGPRVGARFVDATRPEGRALLSAHGIRAHLPVVLFLHGSSRVRVEGREVDFRGFPGGSWTREDLVAALRQAAGAE
ncbi:MAG: hypothetical protein D6731_23295 [Planctomycetota bacterium]|nr:MAG: hypothetical protein D6731_23295 [Planctomycetota bacterium]